MSDLPEDEAPPHPADPPQQLVDFVGQFSDPQAREVFGDASVRLQDYMVKRQIAADNDAAANRLVSNLGQFKDGMASMVYSDPAAVHVGLDIVPDIIDGIVHTNPYLPDDQREEMRTGITSDIQSEIARSGVMSLANKNADAARSLLDNERVSSVLSDQDRLALSGHISAMEMARNVDAAATAKQRAIDTQRTTDYSTTQYFGALVDPNTQEVQFPDGWAQHVMNDFTIPPADTASMLGVYDRLQKTGDVPRSDPFVFADVVQKIADGEPIGVRDILGEAGRGLKLADAVGLARNTVGEMTPVTRKEFADLASTIDAVRSVLAGPENGPAGQQAFGRFMDWFSTSYPAGRLDPNSQQPFDLGAAVSRFLPNSDDVLNAARRVPAERVPLDQIFGPRKG